MSQCTSDSDEFITFGCISSGFSPAEGLTFSWTDSTKKELNNFVQYPAFGQKENYSKISSLTVKKSELDPKNVYTCTASNSNGSIEANVPQVRQVRKEGPKVPDGTPSLYIYKPDRTDTGHVSHVCEVTSPNLGDVNIMWKLDNTLYTESTTSAHIQKKDSISVLSILTITQDEYNNIRATITCSVNLASMTNNQAPLQVSTSKSVPPEPDNGSALDCNKDVLDEDEFGSLWSTATSFIFLFLFSLTYSAVLSFFKVKH